MDNSNSKFHYFILNKPYGVLSQFTDETGRKTLKDLYNFPTNVYPVGRLDMDSEGLLLLTDDKSLTDYLLNPRNRHEREYFVQVEGKPEGADIQKFKSGILIEGKKTLPAKVKLINDPCFNPRVPPIRERKTIPTSWLSITITEGRNRQVRKMTAAVGYPTLRLVRIRIKNISLGNLNVGEARELTLKEVKKLRD